MTRSQVLSYLLFIACCASIYMLFVIKNNVRILNYQIVELTRLASEEQDKIKVLKAEFAYLTSADSLRKLSSNIVSLEAVQPQQMIQDPLSISKATIQYSNNISKNRVKWRYRKVHGKYTHVSAS